MIISYLAIGWHGARTTGISAVDFTVEATGDVTLSRLPVGGFAMNNLHTDSILASGAPMPTPAPASKQNAGKAADAPPKADVPKADAELTESASQTQQSNAGEAVVLEALVSGLRSDFAEAGMVPPPARFAGVSLNTASAEQPDDAGQSTSAERMKIFMVKSILARMINQKDNLPAQETVPQSQLPAEEVAQLDMAV